MEIIDTTFFDAAAEVAEKSLCLRDKCGAVIVFRGRVIATGYNAPPNDDIANRKCLCDFPTVNRKKPKSSCLCCDHAEVRAILNMIKDAGRRKFEGMTLYFTRIDKNGVIETSGEPYCTECARFALHNGISFWVLNHDTGPRLYTAQEYYDISYDFHLTSLK